LWYDEPNAASNAIGYASQYSRSHNAVIRVYDAAGNVERIIPFDDASRKL
jgi:cytochrome oxidase Cu insertion factor (SCO1/SenC/PrrC family)